MLTPKENYLKVLKGDVPEWLPRTAFGGTHNGTKADPCRMLEPSVTNGHRERNGGKDIWGVEYVPTYETGNALIPKPNDFILDDITKWRDVIKAPDLSGVDWESMAKKQLENSKIDRTQTAISFNLHMGFFEDLMSFMGFTEGLTALYEEPEECAALFEYLCDFYCGVAEKCIDYFKPDVYQMMDDTAAWNSPFISKAMFDELLVPVYDRQAKFGRDRGLPIAFHNCGKCEAFIPEMVDFGVTCWDPAQTCNDLKAVKAQYGNSFVLCGGWSPRDHLLAEDITDEEILSSVKEAIDAFAPGGGYIFQGSYLGPIDDKEVARKNALIRNFVDDYGSKIYG